MPSISYPASTTTITGAVTIPGSVTVGNFPANQAVTVTNTGTAQAIPINTATITPTASTNNSTVVQLSPNAVFTGTAEDVSTFTDLDVSILSDQDSAINGASFQFSIDGTTWNFPLAFSVIANQGVYLSIAPRAQFFRLVYTNGPVTTTTLNIKIFKYAVTRSTYQTNVESNVIAGQGVDVVKAVLNAEAPNGQFPVTTFVNVQANTAGALLVDTSASPGGNDVNLNGLNTFQTSQYAVDTTAVQITSSPLSGRSSLGLKALTISGSTVYIGNDSSVTTTTGYPLVNGDSLQMDLIATQEIWAISDNAGQTLCAIEIGD